MKREIELADAKWLLEVGCVVLVTSGTKERGNVMTVSWQTPVNSHNPCLVLLCIDRSRYSYELIKRNNELVINVPNAKLLDAVNRAGSMTGRKGDKFRECSLTAAEAKLVEPPLIQECIAHLECRVRQFVTLGDSDLLICEVLRAAAEEELFDGAWIPDRAGTLHHLGGGRYGVLAGRAKE